jgi:Cu-Zn family superoxide dismutase
MKRTGMLCALVLAACGGTQKSTTQQPLAATSEEASMQAMANPSPPPKTGPMTPAGDDKTKDDDQMAPPTDDSAQAPEGTPAQVDSPKPSSAPTQAIAMMTTLKDGKDVGTVSFELGSDNVVVIQGDFHDLPKGKHAFYIHEGSDCKKLGAHLDPTKQKHGPPSSATRHAGDFGNVEIAKDGTGQFQMSTDSLSFEAGRADTLTGRVLVVHAKADNRAGNAGPAIACGVISQREP